MLSTLQELNALTPAAASDRSCELHQHHFLLQDMTLHHLADGRCGLSSLLPVCRETTVRIIPESPQNAWQFAVEL